MNKENEIKESLREYHKPRISDIEGSGKELIEKIESILLDANTRYFKIELESEGTLYYRGKMIYRY